MDFADRSKIFRRRIQVFRRRVQKCHHRDGNAADATSYRRNTFRKSLKTARSEYYRSDISKAGDMRLFYNIADSLLGRKVNRPLPEVADESHSALATRFQAKFQKKDRGTVP